MSARDFINDMLLPWLAEEINEEVRGNKTYLRGFEDAMRGMARFLEQHRHEWDALEN